MFENVWCMEGASFVLYKRERENGQIDAEWFRFGNGIKVFASEGNDSWVYSTDADRSQVSGWAIGKQRAALFAAGKALVVVDV